MNGDQPLQFIQVGEQQVPLPEGVTVTEWALEKVRWQNPRIRAFLGCTRLLDGVLESNYAILHCSPERLLEIWRKVRKVSDLLRDKIAPLLEAPSCIPQLEDARQRAQMSLRILGGTVLSELERFPREVPPERLMELRKMLCISIGQIHAYLQDTFGEIMARDPRSLHDADYFLSRRFPQDIEEAEWLHSTVAQLRDHLRRLEPRRERHLSSMVSLLRCQHSLPTGERWEGSRTFLEILLDQLTPRLKGVLALRGIRFYEMELLDRYAVEIPIHCTTITQLHTAARDMLREIAEGTAASEAALTACHRLFSARIADLMAEVDKCLLDLLAFVPLWLKGIEKRRALMLRRAGEDES